MHQSAEVGRDDRSTHETKGGDKMGRKTTSRTEKDSTIVEGFFGDHHHVTKITDGDRTVEGRAKTSEESQSRASKKWNDK